MTRLLTGWRPYRALLHVDILHEYLLGLLETPKLTKDNLGIGDVNKFIVHIHILIRANTFDDSVMTQLRLLFVYFARTESAWIHPIDKSVGGTVPTPTEDKHLAIVRNGMK